MKFATNFKRKY